MDKHDDNTRIPMLEPFTVKQTASALSETADYNHRMLNIPEMWKRSRGAGVKVAVLDTGCPQHIDIRVAGCRDFTGSGSPYDRVNGHSTHVCGIIAALANGIGVRGIAPECELYCGRVLDDEGSGTVAMISEGVKWAVDTGADVINMSLGCPPYCSLNPTLREAVEYAARKGVVVCCAAGNDSGAVNAPANLASTIAVAAVDANRERAYFTCHGSEVDFAAGGVDVFSTWLNNQYAKLSGTSMATPVISGVAALVIGAAKAEGAKLTPEQVYRKLVEISVDVDAPGKDEYTGNGIPIFTSQYVPGASEEPAPGSRPSGSWLTRLLRWVAGLFR